MDDVIVADRDALATAPWRTRAAVAVARASWLQRGERLLPHLLAVGYAGVSVAVVAHVDVVPRSYAATSTPAAIVDLAAGLGLIAAGAADAINRQRGSVGLLVTMIGVAWLSADWVGWSDGPAIARSAAMVVAPFLLPLLIHLCIALPTGRVTGRLDRCAVAVAYGVSASVSLSWALLRDPFRDRYCWANCTDNSFLVAAKPELVRSITALWLYSSLVAAVVLAATSAWRFLRQSSTARRTLAAPFGAAVVVVATHALYTVLVLADRAESPSRRALAVVFYMRAAALVGLAAGILWTLLRGLRTRRAVARLAVELGDAPPPGTLRAALARSLDDDHLEVYYWLPASGVYVNDAGEPADPQPGPTQALTPLERDGQPVAVVIHDRLLKTTHDLQHEIGAASRLAVDNERLRAQALAQLSELRASRARIVETADTTRQELERNLHDGAQQRLLALSYELQLAESDARATGDTLLAEMLVMAGQKATTALVELRDLAHGIFPAILAEAGLSPALATLADTAPLRVEFADVPDGRLPDDVETAVYMAVTAIVEHAARRSAKRILGAFTAGDGELGVELIDDGDTTSIDDLIHVADRVGALGGRLDVDGTRLRMVLPCA